ncbi:MAG: adenine phosphoribosyltransferase [bacterium]
MERVTQRLRESIRNIPDFPRPGIVFKDITTLLADADRFREALDLFEARWKDEAIAVVAGVESRGFIFGGALADRLGCAFVPMRKRGRLPGDTVVESYDLEYGTDSLELHSDAFAEGTRVLIVDDLLATGGTAEAAAKLVERLGGEVVGLAFVVNLAFLPGASKLEAYETQCLVEFDKE